MLRTALGPAIAAFLEDPSIVEVMLNPDGRLCPRRHGYDPAAARRYDATPARPFRRSLALSRDRQRRRRLADLGGQLT
jgi:hypothetical protein